MVPASFFPDFPEGTCILANSGQTGDIVALKKGKSRNQANIYPHPSHLWHAWCDFFFFLSFPLFFLSFYLSFSPSLSLFLFLGLEEQ